MFGMGDPEYQDHLTQGVQRGRGAGLNPGNRYEAVRLHVLGDFRDQQAQDDEPIPATPTTVIADQTRSILNEVDSPDLGLAWTLNPYRGCEHGCIYCYARPDHERLGYSCGLDFETKIIAKFDAPRLLQRELAKPRWIPTTVMMAGVTDCYQPLEEKLRITRGCLEVFADCRHPVAIVTKNRLILRDLDLLQRLAQIGAVRVAVSLTTLDNHLAHEMEPRASSPRDRLRTIKELTAAGVPCVVMTAPIIPGLNDRELPNLLQAAAEAGAVGAGYVLLRLPYQIKALFLDWLRRVAPDRAGKVESLLRQCHDGNLYQSDFGVRQRGEGPVAQQIQQLFLTFRQRHGLDRQLPSLNKAHFRRPALDGQLSLFE